MIQIKNPCDADWQKMTPAESGKYCGACEKVVVDFSKMSDDAIKNYFVTYKEQKTCGRFLDSQLDRPLKTSIPSSKFWKHINRFPVFRSVMLIWASSILWLTNCVNKDRTTGEAENQTCESITTGDTVVIDTATMSPPKYLPPILEPDDVVMGEVSTQQTTKMLPPPILMGDVAVCTPPEESDTVAVTIPATSVDTSDVTIHMIKGKVMMTDTISQKIKRKK